MKKNGIYDKIIKGKTFIEEYGVYYLTEELSEESIDTSSDLDEDDYSASSTGTTEDSTDKKRVITYRLYN